MHETMEHLPAGAPAGAPSEVARQEATAADRNDTVSAPVHAPPALTNPPIATLKDALQILLIVAGEDDGEISEALERVEFSGQEVRDLWRLITKAIADLEQEAVDRRGVMKQMMRTPSISLDASLVKELREIERTNRELAGDPSALLDAE